MGKEKKEKREKGEKGESKGSRAKHVSCNGLGLIVHAAFRRPDARAGGAPAPRWPAARVAPSVSDARGICAHSMLLHPQISKADLPEHLEVQRTRVLCGPEQNAYTGTVTSAHAYGERAFPSDN